MLKIVIDTNVFVSAGLGGFVSSKIIEAFVERRFSLLISPPLFNEPKEVLARKEFDLNELIQEKILTFIETRAEFVTPEVKVDICRDPKDNVVLECALSGKADVVVTGDRDLLVLSSFEKVSIITPRQFIKIL